MMLSTSCVRRSISAINVAAPFQRRIVACIGPSRELGFRRYRAPPHMSIALKGNNQPFDPILGIAERLRRGELSPTTLAELTLDRIDDLNPTLNAFITVTADLAREQASTAENQSRSGQWRGPLHGVPVGVKDFYDTAGIRTTAAFERFRNRVPAQDARAVQKLKEAGAIVVGKTNMHQLGMGTTGLESCFGAVQNPWNGA